MHLIPAAGLSTHPSRTATRLDSLELERGELVVLGEPEGAELASGDRLVPAPADT